MPGLVDTYLMMMSPLTIQQLRNRSARCWLRMLQRSCLRIHRLRWAMASLRLLRLVWKWRKYELLMVFWWGALVDDGHVYSHWFICYYVSRKLIVFFHDLRVSINHSTIYIISRRLIERLNWLLLSLSVWFLSFGILVLGPWGVAKCWINCQIISIFC